DTIWMKAKVTDEYIEISVENNGETIPSYDLPQLFSPFYKGNKGKFGLGLAIVKRISELHEGYPVVENTSSGVKFTVNIPIPKQLEKQEKPQKKVRKRDRK